MAKPARGPSAPMIGLFRVGPFLVGLLFFVGCGVEPETIESLREAVRATSAMGTDGVLAGQPVANNLEFNPPSPDRIDPFTFPANAAMSADEPGTTITSAAQVQVLGFADVNGPRVFLRTKETTKLLAIGDKTDGVEVIGIHPPAVDLRMGSLEWRTTMFEDNH